MSVQWPSSSGKKTEEEITRYSTSDSKNSKGNGMTFTAGASAYVYHKSEAINFGKLGGRKKFYHRRGTLNGIWPKNPETNQRVQGTMQSSLDFTTLSVKPPIYTGSGQKPIMKRSKAIISGKRKR